MNFAEFRESRQRTMSNDLTVNEAKANAALGLAGEAGECADIVKKELFHSKSPEGMFHELGDAFFYLDWLADLYGFTLEDIAQGNKDKLAKRFPNGWNSADAQAKRDEAFIYATH